MRRCSGLRLGVMRVHRWLSERIWKPAGAMPITVKGLPSGGLGVERDGCGDDRGGGVETRAPETFADDDDVGAGAVVIGGKGAAGEQGDGQEGEEFLGDRLDGGR